VSSGYIPLNGWTRETIKARIRARNTGEKSTEPKTEQDPSPICLYRAKDGNCCAVGAFIDEEDYSENMEARGYSTLLKEHPSLESKMPLPREAMAALQSVHDKCPEGANVREALCKWIDENVYEVTQQQMNEVQS
jgi:hypothetical protein